MRGFAAVGALGLCALSWGAHGQTTFQYGPLPTQLLDACLPPTGATRAQQSVLLIHGGGWTGGSRQEEVPYCKYLAGIGIAAFTVDYRLDSVPGQQWPAQLADVQLAIRWIRANASSLGVNPAHLCSWGYSAGAQLAMMLGVLPAIEDTDMAQELPSYSPQVQCAVSVSPPSDLSLLWTDRIDLAMIGQLTDKSTTLLVDASPALRVTAASSPAYIVAGRNDAVFPFAQYSEMTQALAAAGVGVVFSPNVGGHVETGLTSAQKAAILQEIVAWVREF